MRAVFLRAIAADDKAVALRTAIREVHPSHEIQRFEVDSASFQAVPRSPFAYWASDAMIEMFVTIDPLQSRGREARFGASPKDRFRFVLLHWEVGRTDSGRGWTPFAKGGEASTYYSDIHLLLRWRDTGSELKAHISAYRDRRGWGSQWTASLNGYEHYGRPGLTWTLRTTSGLSVRALPAGCIFADKGPAAFVSEDRSDELLALAAIANSTAFAACVELQLAAADAAARSYEVGVIQRTPVPSLPPGSKLALSLLARRSWSLWRFLDTSNEVSHAFDLPALVKAVGDTLDARADSWATNSSSLKTELAAIQSEIDESCFDLYGMGEADRRTITQGFGGVVNPSEEAIRVDQDEDEDEREDDSAVEGAADPGPRTAELLAWCVGVAFGRFDVRLATGEREPEPEPEPFDPLPVCSPGMLTGKDGLPDASPPEGYPIALPEDGVLVDDPGHPRDLTAAARDVFEVVFGAEADAFWTEASELVDPRNQDIRRWLQKTYFQEHIKRYSKSRRKAPIYWHLATPSASYSVWLYAHRIGRDSLYQVLNDFVSPKLRAEERKLHALREEAGENPSSSQRKELAAQESFVSELRVLRDEVARVAPLWNPDLNDGVVIVTAPLYRLVPQLKSWQKELKSHWDALCAGKYDWAQLAMHLWPERVVPKCAEDRSLAIAHDLEDVFWEQDADGKWQACKEPSRPVAELVAERTSSAVKGALESLLHAPPLTGGRRPRKAAA